MSGIKIEEIPLRKREVEKSLVDFVSDESDFLADPIPNLYFTRDPLRKLWYKKAGSSWNKTKNDSHNKLPIFRMNLVDQTEEVFKAKIILFSIHKNLLVKWVME